MSNPYDCYRSKRKRVRIESRERVSYLHSKRKRAALCGPVTRRQMTPEERARYGPARKAPDIYEREEPP